MNMLKRQVLQLMQKLFQFHLLNLTDATYVSDAQDGSDHDEASTKVFYGLGMRFNINLNVRF